MEEAHHHSRLDTQCLYSVDFVQQVNCTTYTDFYNKECINPKFNSTQVNECLGCYIDNYCKYIAKMFEIQPDMEWFMQPRLFLYFLAISGFTMCMLGFYLYY